MAEFTLTHARVREALSYDDDTGLFRWRETRNNNARAGQLCGRRRNSDGYLSVCLDGIATPAHRLAWFWAHGEWPPEEVDHINGDRADNRIANLRLATRVENMRNKGLPKNNTSGAKGVTRHGDQWKAAAKVAGQYHYLGLFPSVEAAALRRREFVAAHFGQFVHEHERLA